MAASGCVHRRMTVRTNPPGAAVYIDDYPIGTTPVSTSFIYYGTRKIRIVKDGYQTLTVERKISTPWYQYFPLDFVSENLMPNEIRDERVLDFTLSPQMVVPTDQLIGRAENLRQTGRSSGVIPAGAEVPLSAPFSAPPLGGPTSAQQPGVLPPPGGQPPLQYGSEPVPGIQPFAPGVQALPPTGQPMLPPGTQPVPVPGPTLNPFSRPTVPPPTPGLAPPGLPQ
jgi:hypothetical protein